LGLADLILFLLLEAVRSIYLPLRYALESRNPRAFTAFINSRLWLLKNLPAIIKARMRGKPK